jgi:hypothetical protein
MWRPFASGFAPTGTIRDHDFAPVPEAPFSPLLAAGVPLAAIALLASTTRFDGDAAAVAAPLLLVAWSAAVTLRGTRMTRPGAGFWHAVTGVSVAYSALLAAALVLPLARAQAFLAWVDPAHARGPGGAALPETDYGAHCALTAANVRGHFDIFVLAHVAGWAAKAALFRDVWVSLALSALFFLFRPLENLPKRLKLFCSFIIHINLIRVFLFLFFLLFYGFNICDIVLVDSRGVFACN